MSMRDYSKQVARRQRIGDTTLMVGVDIGCASNAVGFMSKEGKVLIHSRCVFLLNYALRNLALKCFSFSFHADFRMKSLYNR